MLDINNLDESKSGIKDNSIVSDISWSKSQKLYVNIVKPVLDIFFAVIGLILLLPLFLVISVAIKLDSWGPVFFRQERVGKDCRVFKLLKFRSMKVETAKRGIPLKDIERITKVGHFIRKTSLDELPQLINIIFGKMSFIGPRPLLTEYLKYYNSEQIKRHIVTPGISGWSQVNGRNFISWEERFMLDIWYSKNISLKLDLQIFLMTIRRIISQKGINNSIKDTMPSFRGDKKLIN
jgi:undecaprenyl phosphate N,N'-diacetylbacillosamine 1-phosphate transferase